MTAIAQRLEQKLRTLPPHRAASLERLVEDAIAVADPVTPEQADREARIQAHREHIAKSLDMAAALDWSDFERPPQGEYEKREEW